MAYEKYTWVDGELITAEKLNHIEDGIAEGGDTGYTCTETTEQLFNETVTTADDDGVSFSLLAYSEPITADELTVVFNGTQYICSKIEDEGTVYYGGFDPNTGMPAFTNYPFAIKSKYGANFIVTESPMTATVSVSVSSRDVETTECFEKAVQNVNSALTVNATSLGGGDFRLDKTWQEIHDAFLSIPVIIHQINDGGDGYMTVTVVVDSRPEAGVMVMAGGSAMFTADNPTDYPCSYK